MDPLDLLGFACLRSPTTSRADNFIRNFAVTSTARVHLPDGPYSFESTRFVDYGQRAEREHVRHCFLGSVASGHQGRRQAAPVVGSIDAVTIKDFHLKSGRTNKGNMF